MVDAFKPKKFIFLHCCANCEHATRMNIPGSAKIYACGVEERETLLPGAHICDVDIDKVGEQINWFDSIKEAK